MNYLGFKDYGYQGQVKGSPNESGQYLNYYPVQPLNQWIQCIWKLSVPPGPYTFRGIPGNCIDCIFFGDNPEVHFAVLPLLRPEHFTMHGPAEFYGIRLRVLAQHELMSMPIGEWQGESLHALFGERTLDSIINSIQSTNCFPLLCKRLNKDLSQAFLSGTRSDDKQRMSVDKRVIQFASHVHTTTSSRLDLNRKCLSEWGVSERHLRRLCQQYLGLNPKDFHKVVRFQKILHEMRYGANRKIWIDLYHDQSHLNREFKALTGMTPIQFAHSSVLYKTPALV